MSTGNWIPTGFLELLPGTYCVQLHGRDVRPAVSTTRLSSLFGFSPITSQDKGGFIQKSSLVLNLL